MEDSTCHLEPGRMRVLGSHMLETGPSIAEETVGDRSGAQARPSLAAQVLSSGGKPDLVRNEAFYAMNHGRG